MATCEFINYNSHNLCCSIDYYLWLILLVERNYRFLVCKSQMKWLNQSLDVLVVGSVTKSKATIHYSIPAWNIGA
jgi:hypothetical protein